MLALLNIVLGKSIGMRFRDWDLISGSASYLCNLGKLLSLNLSFSTVKRTLLPQPPWAITGLHAMMHVKHLACDWHTADVQ